jgi:hypothetical protein
VSADGITDTSLGSLDMYPRNKLASWQATGHPLLGPIYTEVQCRAGTAALLYSAPGA